MTVRKTLDNGVAQWGALPAGTSGPITIRVRDTDRTPGNTTLDTIAIDRMFLRAVV